MMAERQVDNTGVAITGMTAGDAMPVRPTPHPPCDTRATLTITRGLPGSGTSSWAVDYAQRTRAIRLNRGDLRRMMFGHDDHLSRSQEAAVSAAIQTSASALLDRGLRRSD